MEKSEGEVIGRKDLNKTGKDIFIRLLLIFFKYKLKPKDNYLT